jgi:rod shape-determining protein MreC
VAAFGIGGNRALPGRGPTPGFRFTLYAILSVVLMFMDERDNWLDKARSALMAAAYPVQLAVSSPSAAWQWLKEAAKTREALRAENQELRERLRDMQMRSLRYEALVRENAQLRGLKEAVPPVAERWMAAEIIHVEPNRLRQRILINRGTQNGVFKGQAVLDDQGLVGQTMRVGPWSAEVILVTDPEHAVPVVIERTGVRTIAVGGGASGEIELPFLPANADVKEGDLLLTSGLGGVFPAGYPVGRIVAVHRDSIQPLARATPTAQIDRSRELMLVWFRPGHPAAPADLAATAGDPTYQPQPVPERPAPPSPAPAQQTGAATSAPQPARPTRAQTATKPAETPAPAPRSTQPEVSEPPPQAPATTANRPEPAPDQSQAGSAERSAEGEPSE